jgi:competence protein ComEC
LLPELAAMSALLILYLWGPRYCCVLLPAIWALFHAHWAIDDRLAPQLSGQDILVAGTVCEFPDSDRGVHRFVLKLDRRSPAGLPRRIFLSWYDSASHPSAGEAWRLKVRLKRPRGVGNPGAFDFEEWAMMRQIGATGYVRDSPLNGRLIMAGSDCPLIRIRQAIVTRMENALGESPATGHLLAISVGARNRLSEADWGVLRRTGTVHLMAISGLHIGLVAALMSFVGRQIGRFFLRSGLNFAPLFAARWFAVSGAVAYSALAGFALPAVRALVMVVAVVALTTARRGVHAEQTLGAAVFAVLLVEPWAPSGAGFWLSFYAVTLLLFSGIGLQGFALGYQTRLRRPLGKVQQIFHAQFVLSVGLMPLGIYFFEQVPVVGLISNLLVVPIFALLIVPFDLLGMAVVLVSPTIGAALLTPVTVVMEWMLWVLAWLDGLPFSVWQPPPARPAWVAVSVLATLILIWPRPFRGRMIGLILMIPLLFGSSAHAPPFLRIVVMDVGQGLAILVQTAGHALVYDTGPSYRTRDAGESVVLPVLRHFGIRTLNTLIISHADNDHVGGGASVSAAFPAALLIAPEPTSQISLRYRRCDAGMEWTWDDVNFKILHPEQPGGKQRWSRNDGSCVLLVRAKGHTLLLSGDIEERAERRLAGSALIRQVSLVIAPHHGSNTSSSQVFVDTTKPRFVVFSSGFKNRWGHPKALVKDRWLQAGACLLSTAESGAIVFEVNASGDLRLIWRQRIDGRHIWTEPNTHKIPLPCEIDRAG